MYQHMRALREDRDLTQGQMAELLQVHQTTYSDYELGNVNIPVAALIQLAEFYGTSIDFLVDFTDDPTPYPKP
jgi:transcriptional regulator with XRE-family HTH domain|nr:helix-turn-helix transcriptional regulator [uncultured Oscillibacter sp.]